MKVALCIIIGFRINMDNKVFKLHYHGTKLVMLYRQEASVRVLVNHLKLKNKEFLFKSKYDKYTSVGIPVLE